MVSFRSSLGLFFVLGLLASCTTYGPITATSRKVGERHGRACSKSLFFVFPIGEQNATIQGAVEQGRLNVISHVDYSYTNSLFSQTYCVHAYGK